MSYRYEKLWLAVLALVGTGSIKERLRNALIGNLLALEPDDFPEQHLKQKFNEIFRGLTSVPATANEGSVEATISKITDDEAKEYAQQIFYLYDEVCQINKE